MSDIWILYQTTNLVNGKIYVGVHKVADNATSITYLGSGKTLKKAIKKYGKDNFIRSTLAKFSCAEDAYFAERITVTEDFVSREDTYNIKLGGIGCRGLPLTDAHKAKISASGKGRFVTEETKNKMKNNKNNLGHIHSEESRKKMSASSHNRKPVMINKKYYASANLAAKLEKIPLATMTSRIRNGNSNYSEWRLATKEEIANFLRGGELVE